MSGRVSEVLVLASAATALNPSPLFNSKSLLIQNLGPNPIFIGFSAAEAVVNKARRLAQYDTFTVDRQGVGLYAIAASADQVTGAATIVLELQ